MCLEKYGFGYFLHFTSVCANMNYCLTKRIRVTTISLIKSSLLEIHLLSKWKAI